MKRAVLQEESLAAEKCRLMLAAGCWLLFLSLPSAVAAAAAAVAAVAPLSAVAVFVPSAAVALAASYTVEPLFVPISCSQTSHCQFLR